MKVFLSAVRVLPQKNYPGIAVGVNYYRMILLGRDVALQHKSCTSREIEFQPALAILLISRIVYSLIRCIGRNVAKAAELWIIRVENEFVTSVLDQQAIVGVTALAIEIEDEEQTTTLECKNLVTTVIHNFDKWSLVELQDRSDKSC